MVKISRVQQPRLSLKFFEKNDCHIWVRFILTSDFKNCKKKIRLIAYWRLLSPENKCKNGLKLNVLTHEDIKTDH